MNIHCCKSQICERNKIGGTIFQRVWAIKHLTKEEQEGTI